jgi:REP element-mobilizing transposase RayT
MRRTPQLTLPLAQHGGRRPGAGRKQKGLRPLVTHKARPRFGRPTPAHVTLRVGESVWNLRSSRAFRRLRSSFQDARGRFGLRVIEFSIQGNHLHLIVEANDSDALSRGMQGLCIRIAKALNGMMERSGRVFSDHYHSRLLETPTELVRAIAYVLGNHAHHFGGSGADPYSSQALDSEQRQGLLAPAVGWLLRVGWRRAKRPDTLARWAPIC